MTLKSKVTSLLRNPLLIKDIVHGDNVENVRIRIRRLNEKTQQIKNENEISKFIKILKQTPHFYIDAQNEPKLNRLCCIEDWQNNEIEEIIFELQKLSCMITLIGRLGNEKQHSK